MKKLFKILAVVALLAMVAGPAIAATEWNFGATMRYKTFWNQRDYGKTQGPDRENGGALVDSDGSLAWGTQANSQIRLHMKSDRLSGYFELGYDFDGGAVWTREMWGRYQISDGIDILIGQSFELFNSFISRQVGLDDINMNGIGTNFRPPRPQIQIHFGPKAGFPTFIYSGFVFALVQPESAGGPFGYGMWEGQDAWMNHVFPGGSPFSNVTYDRDTFFPKIEAAYQHMGDSWRIKIAGAYAQHKLNKIEMDITGLGHASYGNKTIHSWNVGLDGDINFGPLYVGANASVGQNWGNAGWNNWGFTVGSMAFLKPSAGNPLGSADIESTTSFMLSLVGAYQLTEDLRFEAGWGWRHDDNKLFDTSANAWTAYLQAAYDVAPGFMIVPEIGYVDYGKSQGIDLYDNKVKGVSEGYLWYAGVYWLMNF